MQLTNLLFVFSGLVASATAGPLEERASSKCVTYAEGSLTTGNITSELSRISVSRSADPLIVIVPQLAPQYQKLSFNSNHEVAYYAAQNKAAIHAQFQVSFQHRLTRQQILTSRSKVCTPNWAGASNKAGSTYLYGRIYIPSSKSCLAAVVSCLFSIYSLL